MKMRFFMTEDWKSTFVCWEPHWASDFWGLRLIIWTWGITAGNKSMIGQWVFRYVVPPAMIINAIQNPISTEPPLSWNTEKIWVTIYVSVFNEEILTCLFWFTVVDGVRACEADNEHRNVSLNTQIIHKTSGVSTCRGRLHVKRDRGMIILHSL